MKFHGLMLVRDEDDIIASCLEHLVTWIDSLYIHDLGSTDSTWEIIQQLASKYRQIVPYRSEHIVYNDGLRCILFNEYRSRFSAGDWIIKIDADEFYNINPPDFVRERVGYLESAVYLQWYFFRLTDIEVNNYESGRTDLMLDRFRPIEERRRMFKIPNYAEPRMFRYRRSMRWPVNTGFPYNAGYVARECIPIRHYPHRDPLQMRKRYRLRSEITRLNGMPSSSHWNLEDWNKDVLKVDPVTGRAIEQTEAGQGLSAASGHTEGELYEWFPGTDLPEVKNHGHLKRMRSRLAQRVIHPLVVPLMDLGRPRFIESSARVRIPDEVTSRLRAENASDVLHWKERHSDGT